jgi:spermidine/putrescine transport system permease protein
MLTLVSFAERDSLGRILWNFSLQNYARAFDWVWLKILLDSLFYAFLTTVICLALGYPAAYFIARAPERWRGILLMLVMVPFWKQPTDFSRYFQRTCVPSLFTFRHCSGTRL